MADTGFEFPDSNGAISTDWSNPTVAYEDSSAPFSPVQISASAEKIGFKFTKDGGSSYGDTSYTPSLNSSDSAYTIGANDDLWGLSLSHSDINDDDDFRLIIIGDAGDEHDFGFSGISVPADAAINGIEVYINDTSYDFGTLFFNYIQIKVYYTEGDTPVIGNKYPLPAFKNIT